MISIGPIGFAFPLLIAALVTLPILWLLLRAIPPAPIRRRFPGVALLLGLPDEDSETDRTPWWLLLLRCLAVGAAIIGFAGPILNPQDRDIGTGPLLILVDGTWANAPSWEASVESIRVSLDDATRGGRAVVLVSLSDLAPGSLAFQGADTWAARLPSFAPRAWAPDPDDLQDWAVGLTSEPDFDTIWMSDGLARDSRSMLLSSLTAKGSVSVFQTARPVLGLAPAQFADGNINLTALRNQTGGEASVTIIARGRDPGGTERDLATVTADFADGQARSEVALSLPAELRNRVTRFEIAGARSAGGVMLTDDGLKRWEIALIAGREDREGLELLSPLHFLRRALIKNADLLDGALLDVLPANPDVIVLADVAQLSQGEATELLTWVEDGGLLVRFAGPRLAASDVSRDELDPLMPVRLRAGGRTVGGAMSWGAPKAVRTFDSTSPFFGLRIPGDVTVTSQVMAQPDPALSERVIASLADGIPLITRAAAGQGQIILFHVTANAEWSTLPLSGLFVQMLERLAISTRPALPTAQELAGSIWVAERVLSGDGLIEDAGTRAGVAGEILAEGRIGQDLPPGLYRGLDQRLALNVLNQDSVLAPAVWPANVVVEGLGVVRETPLKGMVMAAAIAMLLIDTLASLALSGRLRGARGILAGIAAAVLVQLPITSEAQTDDARALSVTGEVVLAYVETGDAQVDSVSFAGLFGLSDRLTRRTSIEPANPVSVNLETDELSFFPLIYWPVTAAQPVPSQSAYDRLNRYLRGGGMILFDTRDADVAGGLATPEGQRLQALARPLDIPPLEIIPQDHVLTRSFYLLQDFPGRYIAPNVWVEAAPPDAARARGMPFRNLNDGVTPVVIGGNDWAAAWAIDRNGSPLFPVGRGFSGERQREIAYRFGINLIMHVLTGNYKSDQVHVPALLDRLGQ